MEAREWLAVWGPGEWTGAPNGQQEHDVMELGRHVAQDFGYQEALFHPELVA
jgi:hypothetical protein